MKSEDEPEPSQAEPKLETEVSTELDVTTDSYVEVVCSAADGRSVTTIFHELRWNKGFLT
jgi:hypothetical protein